MSANVVRLPSTLHDLDRAIRFLRAADATFTRLARMPGTGARYEPHEPIHEECR